MFSCWIINLLSFSMYHVIQHSINKLYRKRWSNTNSWVTQNNNMSQIKYRKLDCSSLFLYVHSWQMIQFASTLTVLYVRTIEHLRCFVIEIGQIKNSNCHNITLCICYLPLWFHQTFGLHSISHWLKNRNKR